MVMIFKHGVINSGKTANIIMLLKQLDSRGKKAFLMKPSTETDKCNTINSKAFKFKMVVDVLLESNMSDFSTFNQNNYILVDESHLLSEKNIEGLKNISNKATVIFYGLLTDYTGRLFNGSKRLIELCDDIEEIKTTCSKCNSKATINAKYISNEDEIVFFDNESNTFKYTEHEIKHQVLCWWCFKDTRKINNLKNVVMFFDGGSRGNPGLSGIGVVIYCKDTDKELHTISNKLYGDHTNNQSEYTALIKGLEFCNSKGYKNLEVKGDSELVVKQLNGIYNCKSEKLISLYDRAKYLITKFDQVSLSSVKREYNKRADELANIAMDS